jgi:Sulfotransferase family
VKFYSIDSSATQLMAGARSNTSIDIVDTEIEEALTVLLASLNTEACLSETGAVAMKARLLRILSNRLRMFRDYRAHPEIEDEKIVRPLMITGGGRTGSTKLHNLLASSDDFKYITFWQDYTLSLRSGDPNEDPAPRIRDAEDYIAWFDSRAPKSRLTHTYEAFGPEEETYIFEQCRFGMFFIAFAFVPSFVEWYMNLDFRDEIIFFKKTLKYLQWQFYQDDPRPWLLKNPMYQGQEPLLKEVFPDAIFVTTHRDPVTTLTSSASLFAAYHQAYSDADFDGVLGYAMLEAQALRLKDLVDARLEHPEIPVLEIPYSELTNSSESVINSIYDHGGMELKETSLSAMRQWERENVQHKHGAHAYTLEQFSLTTEMAIEKYRFYTDRFSHLF